jgi:DNA-binding transcriptional MerR regulator
MVTLLQPLPPDPPADDPGARPRKSSAAFRTISEVADELDVAQHVLRFWESKFPQVRPLKRGGGRRYYRPEDVELLRQIRSLLYEEGYTIKGAQKLLRGRRPRAGAEEPPAVAAAAPLAPRVVPAARAARTVAPEASQRLKGLRDELKEIRELLARARAELP